MKTLRMLLSVLVLAGVLAALSPAESVRAIPAGCYYHTNVHDQDVAIPLVRVFHSYWSTTRSTTGYYRFTVSALDPGGRGKFQLFRNGELVLTRAFDANGTYSGSFSLRPGDYHTRIIKGMATDARVEYEIFSKSVVCSNLE